MSRVPPIDTVLGKPLEYYYAINEYMAENNAPPQVEDLLVENMKLRGKLSQCRKYLEMLNKVTEE